MAGGDGPRRESAAELKEQLLAERRGVPFLVYRDDGDVQRIVELDQDTARLTIGRAPANDVPLPWDGHVSRVHAELSCVAGDWFIDDQGLSRNGTWMNGERLVRRRRLENGDVVRVGTTLVHVRVPSHGTLGTTAIDSGEPPEATVSPAQRRVLIALCRPLSDGSPYATPATNQQIASELFLTVEAVKTHLRALFAKFGVEDLPQNQKRTALAARALSSGAVRVDDLAER